MRRSVGRWLLAGALSFSASVPSLARADDDAPPPDPARNLLGWTSDGGAFVFKEVEETAVTGGDENEEVGGSAEIAVVVDASGHKTAEYVLKLEGKATAAERARYGRLPDKAAFDAWTHEHPLQCVPGRASPDGASRADIKLAGKGWDGEWSGGTFTISHEPTGDDLSSDGYHATLTIRRGGKRWLAESFEGRVSFAGLAQDSDVRLCWAPDGKHVTWLVHTERTMRDPDTVEMHVSSEGQPSFNPDAAYASAEIARRRASHANSAGMRLYHRKNFVGAVRKFRDAVAVDAGYVQAHYNLACAAALAGDRRTAIAELTWLAASADPESRTKLAKASKDADLASVIADPAVTKLLPPAK